MDTPSTEPGPLALILILLAFPLVFVGFWSAVCVMLSVVGGWSRLARRFATDQPQPAGAQGSLGAMVGFVSYRGGVLEAGAAPDGLDLRVMTLFRPGHRPLRIPWEQVEVQGEGSFLFGRWTRLRLGGEATLRIDSGLWAQLANRAGR